MNLRRLCLLGFASAIAITAGCSSIPPAPEVTDPPQIQAAAIKERGGVYKIGNPYKVLGRWYYPKEEYDYSEIGMASWYGPDFHAKVTANGEKYNMHALTAAHRTLPLPSIVKITNLENGRSLVVRVNDRGPYARDRIIDVSKKVAQLLGFQAKGTAKVKVEVMEKESKQLKAALTDGIVSDITPAPAATLYKDDIAPIAGTLVASETVPVVEEKNVNGQTLEVVEQAQVEESIDEAHGYFVQAGAFANPDAARRLSVQLSEFGNSQVYKAIVHGKTFYRVRVGPYVYKEDAFVTKAKINDFGIPAAQVVQD